VVSVKDICWAAGFLEGEGCFSLNGRRVRIDVGQVQKEPLDRLKGLFGGSICYKAKHSKPDWSPSWHWSLGGPKGVGLMMSIYGLMSPVRKGKIFDLLKYWRSRPCSPRYRTHCKNGHRFTATNTYRSKRGERVCKVCRRKAARMGMAEFRKCRSGSFGGQLCLRF